MQTRFYDRLDGAQPNAAYFNSAACSPDGRVWFANGQVVQMVDPSTLSRKALPAPTYIESVIVDRREYAARGNLGLAPHPRDLQIDYTSPTFAIPQKVKFRYRLDSYDSDWHDAGTRRQAFYTDLPPGNYTFRVIAANSDGVWNETPATLEFSIAPAYYQTNWFRALVRNAALALRVGGLPAAHPWVASPVRGDVGGARRRAHAHRARAARHAVAELPRTAAAVPDRVQPAAGSSGGIEARPCERHRPGGRGDHGGPRCGAGTADLGHRDERSRRLRCARSPKSSRTRAAADVAACRGAGHAAGAASDRARRGLPHRRRSAAQRLPPRRCQADRSGASLRRAAASGAGARRRQGDRPGGVARGGTGRAFRVARDAGTREARRRQAHGLERARRGNRGGIEHSGAARVQ